MTYSFLHHVFMSCAFLAGFLGSRYMFEALSTRLSKIESPCKPERRYRHIKTGGTYRVMYNAVIESTWTPAVIYRCERYGLIVVRPADEFYDGRFVEIDEKGEPL